MPGGCPFWDIVLWEVSSPPETQKLTTPGALAQPKTCIWRSEDLNSAGRNQKEKLTFQIWKQFSILQKIETRIYLWGRLFWKTITGLIIDTKIDTRWEKFFSCYCSKHLNCFILNNSNYKYRLSILPILCHSVLTINIMSICHFPCLTDEKTEANTIILFAYI